MKARAPVLGVLCGLSLAAAAFALDVPAPTGRYVSDFASMLSAPAVERLESVLSRFDRETSSQIVVVTLPGLKGDSLEDFSIRLAQAWKPGTAKKDNGIILLIFRDDRAVRIEVGYGLEGALPDAVCDQIIRREIVPAFREGRVDEGVTAAVEAMMAATRGEYKAQLPAQDPFQELAPGFFVVLMISLLLPWVAYPLIAVLAIASLGFPGGLLLAAVVILFMHLLRRALLGRATFTSGGRGFGGWGGSGGGFSGGGFGGFSGGGGSFGGGGASGRW